MLSDDQFYGRLMGWVQDDKKDYRDIKKKPKVINKGWGHEEWICNTIDFCGKLLFFDPGKKCSMHFHVDKSQYFRVMKGKFSFSFVIDGNKYQFHGESGDIFYVWPGLIHQMQNIGKGQAILMQISTHHQDSDSYRVQKGD